MLYRKSVLFFFFIPALFLSACQKEVQEGVMGELVGVKNGVLSNKGIDYTPRTYELVFHEKSGFEVLDQFPRKTPVTLISHKIGAVHHTKVTGNARRYNEAKDMSNYRTSLLETQPAWLNDTTQGRLWNTTAILKEHVKDYEGLECIEVPNKILAGILDAKIRSSKDLFASVFKDEDPRRDAEKLEIAKRKGLLPLLKRVKGTDILMVTYDYEGVLGKSFLLVNDKFYPLVAWCSSEPFFYKIGQQVYLRYNSYLCESGYIFTSNYAIMPDAVVEEWVSVGYSN